MSRAEKQVQARTQNQPPATWGRCDCGARIEIDHSEYGTGYVGTFRDACQPCWERAEDEAYTAQWTDYAYGPGPAVFDGDW